MKPKISMGKMTLTFGGYGTKVPRYINPVIFIGFGLLMTIGAIAFLVVAALALVFAPTSWLFQLRKTHQ